MRLVLSGARLVLGFAFAIAAASALAGFLIAHFGHFGRAAQGVGWGMCIGGGVVALVVGQSGSPSRMALEGRTSTVGGQWGSIVQIWARNPALPQSPLWSLASCLLVFAAGIAVVVLTY